nr:DUF2382 domain-containing protein [uncultured Halomonas sp.]
MCNSSDGDDAGPEARKRNTPIPTEDGSSSRADVRSSDHSSDEETVIPVLRENLSVQKRIVETGKGVRIRKTVREHEEVIDEPLFTEEVSVERIPIEALIEETAELPTPRYEGETMIIPVLEEVLIMQKRTMLKEELHVTRVRREVHCEPQHVVLRAEEVTVEHFDDSETSGNTRNQD